jgi:uncharacterized protein YkwD
MARLLIAVAALCAVVGSAASPAAPARRATSTMTPLEAALVNQVNGVRREHGLAPVRPNRRLAAAADSHSDEMAADGYFDHSSLDGTSFWKRIGRWYGAGGYGYWSVGENLLWSSPGATPRRALELWMASPPHRANILNPAWREIGISAVHEARAPGVYGGRAATIITADFGVRR